MMKMRAVTIVGILLLFMGCSKAGPPAISVKWPKVLVEGGDAAVFMVILNDGKGADRLKGCSLKEMPDVVCEIHDVVDGRMKMVREIEVPPEGTVELRPGGRHLMLIGGGDRLEKEVTLLLDFERSGGMEVRTGVVR